MGEMTGARAGLVASIVHRWKVQGRIVTVARGRFRKIGRSRERRINHPFHVRAAT